ncbi:NAD(P)-dependent oxidoreductase [Candidatus Uhrbacteria bacterium]|nr:NAD(P)-dependent oxidoreductase [Candidatus Uhrbacteria bacterium]
MRIGFIGLGIMGTHMVRHLIRAGHQVMVWNRTASKATALEAEGVVVARSPRTLGTMVEVVITCVTDTSDVEEVLFGAQGVAECGTNGLVVVDMSTISAGATRTMAARFKERGIDMLDAPVSGGELGAKNASLSIMVGGKREVLERVRPILAVLGKSIVYVGEHGAGQTVKACNQILCAVTLVGVCEAIALARRAGVDPQKMLEVTRQGAGGSWTLDHLGPKILAGDLSPAFMVMLMQKDLGLVVELADEVDATIPGTMLAQSLMAQLVSMGLERFGTQALVKAFEE